MEAVSLIAIWLCIPCGIPGAGQPCPVHLDDLTLFPPIHVVRAERTAAWGRYQYAKGRHEWACCHGCPDRDHWLDVKSRAFFAWDMIDDILRAQCPHEFRNDSPT